MARPYELLVKVDVPKEVRAAAAAWRALAACPRCGALAVDRDLVRDENGHIDAAASFAQFACGNFSWGGDVGALACSMHNLREAIIEAFRPLVAALAVAIERIARRLRRQPEAPTPGSRVLLGPATVYIGDVGSPDQEPTWHRIGHTPGVEVERAVE